MRSLIPFVLFALAVILCSASTSSCNDDPEIIIQKDTVVIIDTVKVIDTFTVIETIFQTVPDTATTFILVRHAETTGGGSNPGLSASGQTRAAELRRILGNVPLNSVFSTNFFRTMQTAEPVATDHSLTIQTYDPFAPETLVDQSLLNYPEGIVLIVGHSNTTPDLLNIMTGSETFPDIPESEYDNLFVVHVSEKGDAKVIHMKYGE
jgi:broad specificity phosphatase PhoE